MITKTFTHPQPASVDTVALALQARRERDRYVGQLLGHAFTRTYDVARRWLAHRRTIAELKQLDARILADIGLDRAALGNGAIRRQQDDRVQALMHGSTLRPVAEISQLAARSVEPHLAPATSAVMPANSDTRHAA
ncbi:MAG: DUF1127 domain-containing protein [Alphaproteobacteria bacterium]|nr:DUF1127 domain-containing protein [Alphaproteobacteria bacterium]